jgi:hypothetical protein
MVIDGNGWLLINRNGAFARERQWRDNDPPTSQPAGQPRSRPLRTVPHSAQRLRLTMRPLRPATPGTYAAAHGEQAAPGGWAGETAEIGVKVRPASLPVCCLLQGPIQSQAFFRNPANLVFRDAEPLSHKPPGLDNADRASVLQAHQRPEDSLPLVNRKRIAATECCQRRISGLDGRVVPAGSAQSAT